MSIDRRSRPSSVVGSESPSSKSSDSFKHPNAKTLVLSAQHRNSIKKRSAPAAPAPKDDDSSSSNNSNSAKNHNRTSSDSGQKFNSFKASHLRNFSADLSTDSTGYESKVSTVRTNPQSVSVFVTDSKSVPIYASVQKPRCAPPLAPDPNSMNHSIESIPSISSESEDYGGANRRSHVVHPVPPPRRVGSLLDLFLSFIVNSFDLILANGRTKTSALFGFI